MHRGSIDVDEQALIWHVEKICNSPEFHPKPVLCRFLSYIVSETLAGRGDDIKAFSIGVDVFKRDEDFDPGQDTLVRINAGRLRRMLDLYYSNTGKDDRIRIEIPKGGYVPRVIELSGTEEKSKPDVSSLEEQKLILDPSIAVLSFKDLSEDPKGTYFARGFSHELLVELTNFEDLHVYNFLTHTDHPEKGDPLFRTMQDKGIRFTLGGAIHGDNDRINLLVDLRDLSQGKQIWSKRYSEKKSTDNLLDIQERVVQDISVKLGGEYGFILRRLSQDDQNQRPYNWSTHTAELSYYNYLFHTTPESAEEAFEALKKAVKDNPRSGIALSYLAAMHGTAYALDYPDAENSYCTAGELAERAYNLDSHNLFIQISLAFKCFLYNEKERFFHLADRILERNPKSALRLGSLGFYLALYGDWDRGKQILDSVMNGQMEYPRFLHGATTLYYYRDHSYELALREAEKYEVPGFFWGPMLRAIVLGQLSESNKARTELQDLKRIKPGFEQNAHYLISRFVKEEDLIEHIKEGLEKAGLHIPADASRSK